MIKINSKFNLAESSYCKLVAIVCRVLQMRMKLLFNYIIIHTSVETCLRVLTTWLKLSRNACTADQGCTYEIRLAFNHWILKKATFIENNTLEICPVYEDVKAVETSRIRTYWKGKTQSRVCYLLLYCPHRAQETNTATRFVSKKFASIILTLFRTPREILECPPRPTFRVVPNASNLQQQVSFWAQPPTGSN